MWLRVGKGMQITHEVVLQRDGQDVVQDDKLS